MYINDIKNIFDNIISGTSIIKDVFQMGNKGLSLTSEKFKSWESAWFSINIFLELSFINNSLGERVCRWIPFSLGSKFIAKSPYQIFWSIMNHIIYHKSKKRGERRGGYNYRSPVVTAVASWAKGKEIPYPDAYLNRVYSNISSHISPVKGRPLH